MCVWLEKIRKFFLRVVLRGLKESGIVYFNYFIISWGFNFVFGR